MTPLTLTQSEHSQDLQQHINNQDPHIQFTVEPTQQGSLPFLGTLVTIEPDNTFSTTVYRKPTHTDQYLHWDRNNYITAKQSVFNTLAHRAKLVFFYTGQNGQGAPTHEDSTTALPVSIMGSLPMATQVHPSQPAQHHHHQQQQQFSRQQQKQQHHCILIYAQYRRKAQETV